MTAENGATKDGHQKKRVLVVGAGCAGMSAAYAFSLSPDKFDVKVYDKAPSVGGSATSYQLPADKDFGAQYINDGVQGASPVFFNTFKMFEETLGFKASDVGMQISFGKGKDTFWSNVYPTELVDEFQADIKKVSGKHVSVRASLFMADTHFTFIQVRQNIADHQDI